MSTEPIRCHHRVLATIFATGVLISCGPAARPDPVDQARAAIQAELGETHELRAIIVETEGGRTVVCGWAGRAKEGDERFPPPDTEFVVLDGRLVEGEAPPSASGLVERCVSQIVRPLPGVRIH